MYDILPVLNASQTEFNYVRLSKRPANRIRPILSDSGVYTFVIEGHVFVADPTASNQAAQFRYRVESLTLAAVNQFSAIDEVGKVYRTIDEERVYFYVFTSNKVYDYELMKRLISVEIDLSKKYPDVAQIYRYTASVLVEDDRYITDCDEPPIYSR